MPLKHLEYRTMPISEICNLPIRNIADDDCLLLMWTTNSMLPEALGIIRNWRFEYDKLFTWCKNNGMGGHPRNATEHLILASIGMPDKGRTFRDKAIMNWVQLPVRQKHSEKPPEIFPILELFAPEPRIELFARTRRLGWDAWGDEVKCDISMDT